MKNELALILHNLDKYPLTGVAHFELEIDYPFIKNVIDYPTPTQIIYAEGEWTMKRIRAPNTLENALDKQT